MVSFFERLQKNARLYENNAPAYMRTHPLTGDRITEMEGRVRRCPAGAGFAGFSSWCGPS